MTQSPVASYLPRLRVFVIWLKHQVQIDLAVECSAFPSGSGAKAKTVLGFLDFPVDDWSFGYRPRIRVVLTVRPTAPSPRVARCEKAIPLLSADTNAVCRVPRNPTCKIAIF